MDVPMSIKEVAPVSNPIYRPFWQQYLENRCKIETAQDNLSDKCKELKKLIN